MIRFIVFGLLTYIVVVQTVQISTDLCTQSIKTGNIWPCIGTLALDIWRLHQWTDQTPVNICGMSCLGSIKGRISRLQWKWDGRFRCPENLPGIEGRDTKKSRKGAMESAIENFFAKAIESGKLKIEDLQCSINK